MQAPEHFADKPEQDFRDSPDQTISSSLQLEQYLPYRFNQLADQISSNLTAVYSSEFGVSLSEWRILALLGQQATMISTDISHRTKMDKAKVSRAVHKLGQEGCLHRERDEQDHRVSHLSLTQAGIKLYNSIIPKALEWESRLVATLAEEERVLLHRLMNKLDSQMRVIAGEK
ncbi:MarR family winged helix-turn-helix transcriptional regulator [Oceanospirillum linum]|uniref:MarR family winged helix-turn-helix transcriptional regulator n=1 Tax=Oceanospirillum linum TaxID=966 RepID=UPI00089F1855|nr:MarR family transcriptional regulator [Oceanospirillum linum]SEG12554.1 DNA-binding transcriptional regulator, MarR family [Oleiphilus messinensis]SMP09708.1 DNA-binding transcriptional regulator, MarR family [Oceanospirillum linum]